MQATETLTIAELDARLNELILEGKALEAFDEFYADDCEMRESGMEPFVGKDFNREREEDFFSKITEFRGAELKETGIADDVTFSIWTMDYTHEEWGDQQYEQVAVRHWRDGQIVREHFYRG